MKNIFFSFAVTTANLFSTKSMKYTDNDQKVWKNICLINIPFKQDTLKETKCDRKKRQLDFDPYHAHILLSESHF